MAKFIISGFGDEISPILKEQMDTMEELGVKYIEARNVNEVNVSSLTVEQAKAAKAELDARGFQISSIGSPIGKIKLADDFDEHMEVFKRTLETAHILEAPYIRMFSFYMEEEADPAACRGEVMEKLGKLVDAAKESGIKLLHENEKGIYGDNAERCLDIVKTMNSDYLRLVFDPANFVQVGETTYPKAFEMLVDYVEYVHIKDALYKDNTVVPAGHGDGKVKEILAALKARNYEGFLSLEPHLAHFPGLDMFEHHLKLEKIPNSGSKVFAIAHQALMEILKTL